MQGNVKYEERIIDKTIHELFREQVLKTPNNVAVRFGNLEVTYKEMYYRVNTMAAILRENRITTNSIVGVMANRSIEMLISIFAVLKAGGAYLPIDPDYPDERIGYMLKDSNVKLIISHKSLAEKIKFERDIIYLDNIDFNNNNEMDFYDTVKSGDLAYVIYTSGSTGNPKGVMIEHGSVVNFIEGICNVIDFSEGKRILALTTISFDIFVLETLLPLTRGLTVVLADENIQINPKLIYETIINNKIDMLQMTPSRMQLLISYDKILTCLSNVSEIIIGGEAFPERILDKIKFYSNAKIYNMYGPTETTIWSTVSDLTDKESIDIGKPILNTQLYIIDKNNALVLEGNEGELCIGGKGLARGYLNKPELTLEVFVENPFFPGERMYKTGDVAKLLPDGIIKCLGRLDDQVKIRGHRIELGEIEIALLKHNSIKQSVARVWEGRDNINYLCAYYVSDKELQYEELINYMSNILPDYMIPSYFIRISNIPLTPNGKVNRKALPNPESISNFNQMKSVSQYEDGLNCNDIEAKIIEIINDIIDIPISINNIDLNTKLYNLGINSISFIKIVVAIESEFDFELEDQDLNADRFSTIHSIISYVSDRLMS